MKKIAIIASILAAVSFVSCNKELTPEVKAPEAANTITLNLGAETRTTYSGNTTTWNADDSISVFICKHGTQASAEWTNYKFTCKDAAAGTFSAEVDGLSSTEDYDMFAFYPYYSGWTTPASASFNISYNQKITGIDGKSGKRFQPLWGSQTTGQKISALSMNMQQVATFFKFNITANDDITISSITMTAPEGVYLGTSVVVNALDGSFSDGSYTKNSVTSTVTGGVIEAGETGTFTMLVRPFALTSGQKLECVLATTDGQKMTIELTAPAAGYNFEAGKVNKVNRTFTVDPEVPKALPYEEAFTTSIGDFTTKNVTLPSDLTYVWSWNSSKYMKASAYVNSTYYATESWLVSPLLDLSKETKAYLSFSYAINYGTPADYDNTFYLLIVDGDKTTKVSIPNLPSKGSWTWYNVKELDLSAYCGKKVKVAFVYTSTSTAGATVEVKDVKVSNAQEVDNAVYTLSFTANSSNSSYASSYDVTCDKITWNVPGNQAAGAYVKLGGKLTAATDRYLYSKTAITNNISSVVLNHGTKDTQITVNSVTLTVYDSADNAKNGTSPIATVSGTFTENGKTTFKKADSTSWAGKYYRITYNLSSSASSKNYGIILNSVGFYD